LEQSLERTFFIGTGYVTLDAADEQVVAVCVQDVAVIACKYMTDHVPVITLTSTTGHLLAALPWPDGITSDAAAVAAVIARLADA
jgi:hypothetical protein